MINYLQKILKKNTEIVALIFLILVSAISTTYYNFSKKNIIDNYIDSLNNVYFQKTLNNFFDSLEPKFKKIHHKISPGETFFNVLEQYEISNKEINEIIKKLSEKVNLNKLKMDQKIIFTIDQSNNVVKEFIFKISSTEKIYLTRDLETDKFNQRILVTKLNKKIIYKENIILQSLYKSAIDEGITANTIINFAGIYGFQVDF